MTVVNTSQGVNSPDTLTMSVTSGLTVGTYSLSSGVDNRPTAGSVVAYDLADLRITLSGAVTPTLGDFAVIWASHAMDGTNYVVNSAVQPPPSLPSSPYGATPVSTQYLDFYDLPLKPYLTKILFWTKLSPTITISSATLYRRNALQW